jgi:hypothetical protein
MSHAPVALAVASLSAGIVPWSIDHVLHLDRSAGRRRSCSAIAPLTLNSPASGANHGPGEFDQAIPLLPWEVEQGDEF